MASKQGKKNFDTQRRTEADVGGTLAAFACPNEDCSDFNRFGAGNLSVCERTGKDRQIRRLYCRSCGRRFSERQGTLLEYAKLPEKTVVQIVKCLAHGCSVEATADICEVTPRTVESLLERAGRRAEDFHRLQLDKITRPLEVVELDELHARSAPAKKGALPKLLAMLSRRLANGAARAARGFMPPWRCRPVF
jgi:transposase-like protein